MKKKITEDFIKQLNPQAKVLFKEYNIAFENKIIYFDDNKVKFDDVRNLSIKATIFLSCLFLSLYFISPSIIGSLLNELFI